MRRENPGPTSDSPLTMYLYGDFESITSGAPPTLYQILPSHSAITEVIPKPEFSQAHATYIEGGFNIIN